jgi:YebC/PmpR family DNA-binding regulatory protein
MAGHSKWKNIKYKKAATDAVKMRRFTKLSKEITVAAKFGSDIATNPALRVLVEKANVINMPKENYLRAIKKASGIDKAVYETAYYQGYAPGNVAIVVEVLSDNKNRIAAEIRRIFNHNGGRLTEPGSVDWMFIKCGLIEGSALYHTEEELLEELLEYKLYDLSYEEGTFFIAVDLVDFNKCKEQLQSIKCIIDEAYVGYHPQEKLRLTDQDQHQLATFMEILESEEDIQNIFINAA